MNKYKSSRIYIPRFIESKKNKYKIPNPFHRVFYAHSHQFYDYYLISNDADVYENDDLGQIFGVDTRKMREMKVHCLSNR